MNEEIKSGIPQFYIEEFTKLKQENEKLKNDIEFILINIKDLHKYRPHRILYSLLAKFNKVCICLSVDERFCPLHKKD